MKKDKNEFERYLKVFAFLGVFVIVIMISSIYQKTKKNQDIVKDTARVLSYSEDGTTRKNGKTMYKFTYKIVYSARGNTYNTEKEDIVEKHSEHYKRDSTIPIEYDKNDSSKLVGKQSIWENLIVIALILVSLVILEYCSKEKVQLKK